MTYRSPNVENYILGKGKLYFDRFDDAGASTGEFDLGNAPDFVVTPAVETLDHFESMAGIKEKDKSVDISVGFTCKFTLEEYSRWNLMLAIMATNEGTYSQATGHQVNEAITAHSGKWTKLTRRNVHDCVVTSVNGLVTYTATTDYLIDQATGRLFTVEDGSIADAQALHVDYLHDSTTYGKLSAMEDSTIEGSLRFVGNPSVGPKYEVEIWKVKIKPTGDVKWISEEWSTIEVEGEILKDAANHPTEPWFTLLDTTENESAVS